MKPHGPSLLIVEDDPATRTFLADNLAADGYEPRVAEDAGQALRRLEAHRFDLCLLDLGLPDASGHELLRAVRRGDRAASRIDPSTPVIVCSGRSSELDRVRALEAGADDVVAKPFSYRELRLRIDAVLRRAGERPAAGRIRVGALEIDRPSRTVLLRGEPVTLAAREYALLLALAAEPTRVFTKDELLRDVWGFRSAGTTRTLDAHACRLRAKLGQAGDRYVVNVWGVGYRLVDGPVGA